MPLLPRLRSKLRIKHQVKNKMEYIYGALLLHSAGQKVNEADMKKVMTASGAKVDETKIKALVASLEGVNIDEAVKKAAVVAAPAAAPAAGAAPAKSEAKKSVEDQAKAEESAAEGLGALFG